MQLQGNGGNIGPAVEHDGNLEGGACGHGRYGHIESQTGTGRGRRRRGCGRSCRWRDLRRRLNGRRLGDGLIRLRHRRLRGGRGAAIGIHIGAQLRQHLRRGLDCALRGNRSHGWPLRRHGAYCGHHSRGRRAMFVVSIAQRDGSLSQAGVDDAQVGLIQLLRTHDMRHHHEDNVVILDGVVPGAEDVLDDGNGAQPRDAAPVLRFLLVLNASQDAGLALAEADGLINHALADNGLRDAADGLGSALGRDLDLDLQGDVVVIVDAGCHLDVHAYVLVLELGVDQRADQRRGCAGFARRWRACAGSEGPWCCCR